MINCDMQKQHYLNIQYKYQYHICGQQWQI